MYEEKASFDVLKGTVPDFRKGKGDVNFIALTVNGEKASTIPPKGTYSKIDVNCDNEAEGVWNVEEWDLNVKHITKVPTSCTVDFIINSGDIIEYNYTGDEQEFIAPADGKYQIELWGAAGGKYSNGHTLGGYTKGEIELTSGTTLYIYVGGEGSPSDGNALGGYNGGGNSTINKLGKSGSTGGGATDVRLTNGAWNEFESLKSRIMVAGGGAGGGGTGYGYCGGSGGGLNGYDGCGTLANYQGRGGSQTSGGSVAWRWKCASTGSTAGSFGIGGIGGANSNNPGDSAAPIVGGGAGGGGGYYGGSGGSGICCGDMGAGGGSSYISGHDGCKAITEDSTDGKITHLDTSEHYSRKIFTETVIIDGSGYNWTTQKGDKIDMPTHDGSEERMEGNSGDGFARITYIGE